jgi:hypothetical protein
MKTLKTIVCGLVLVWAGAGWHRASAQTPPKRTVMLRAERAAVIEASHNLNITALFSGYSSP